MMADCLCRVVMCVVAAYPPAGGLPGWQQQDTVGGELQVPLQLLA